MSLKLHVDTLDAVDENLRSLYVADGAKFKLQVADLDDTISSRVSEATKRANKEAEGERLKRKQWETLGKTPDEIQAIIDAQAKLDEEKARKAGEFDKILAQVNENTAKQIKAKDEVIASKDKTLHRYLIDSQATAAIAAAKGVPDLLLPHVQRHVRVQEKDGDHKVVVVDAAGDPRVNGKGEPLTISDLVSEMKQSEIYGRAFDGSGQSGSGTQPANGSGATHGTAKTKADLMKGATTKDAQRKIRAAFIDANGGKYQAYAALPDGGFKEAPR